MKIAIVGGSGFLGREITRRAVEHGHDLVILSRHPEKIPPGPHITAAPWTLGQVGTLPPHDALINLAGESISTRWTEEKKKEILETRRDGTRSLVESLAAMSAQARPKVFVCASAVGYYGNRADEVLTEQSSPGSGFLADVCAAWEGAADEAASLNIRVVKVRLGVVLGKDGGALEKMLPPFKLGVGGPMGSGRQWFPWVHLADAAGLFLFAAENASLTGPVNATAPGIVRGSEFARTLGKVLHRPALLPVPLAALRLLLGEFALSLVESQRATPAAAMTAGYSFAYPNLSPALSEITA